MRSSKNRSRSKSNRQRSLGNIVNRVFDSSGPEGKVRGTPQQIIDKYLTLARDAQLSNDRVAEQNFLQHAEHYTRMLGEAQREQELRQQNQGDGGGQNQNQQGQNQQGQNGGNGGQGGDRQHPRNRNDDRNGRDQADGQTAAVAGGTEDEADDGPGLVDTPEAKHRTQPSATMMPDLAQPTDDAMPPATKKTGRGSRGPRKPREKRSADEAGAPADDTSPKAAE